MPTLNQWLTVGGQQYMVSDQGGQLVVFKRASGVMGKGQAGLANQRVATNDPLFQQVMQAAGYQPGQVNSTTNAASASIPQAAPAQQGTTVTRGGPASGRQTPSSIAISKGQPPAAAPAYINPIAFGSRKDAQGNTIYNAQAIGAGAMSEDGDTIWDGSKWISASENEARKPKPVATPAPAPAPAAPPTAVRGGPTTGKPVVKPPAPVAAPLPAPKPPVNPAPPAMAGPKPAAVVKAVTPVQPPKPQPAPLPAPKPATPAPAPLPQVANPATPKQDAANPIASAAAVSDALNSRYQANPVTTGQVNDQAAVLRQGDDPMLERLRRAATTDVDATAAMPALRTGDVRAFADDLGVDFQPVYDQAEREFQRRQKALQDYLGNVPGGSGAVNAQLLDNVRNYATDVAALKTQNRLSLLDRARQDLTGNIGLAENRRTQGLNTGQYLQGQANRAQDVAQNILGFNANMQEGRYNAALGSAERGMDRVVDTTRHLQDLAYQDRQADIGRSFDAGQRQADRDFQTNTLAGQRAHEQSQLNQQGRAALTGSLVQNFLPRILDQILPPQLSQTDQLNQQLFNILATQTGLVNQGGQWSMPAQAPAQGPDTLTQVLQYLNQQGGGMGEDTILNLLNALGVNA